MISKKFYVARLCQQGFSDLRFGDIIIVKPMRDYSAKEIAYYNRMFSVRSVFIPSLETKVSLSIRTPGLYPQRDLDDSRSYSLSNNLNIAVS